MLTNLLRVSNISQLAGVPYKLLRQIPGILYEEGSPTENAEKLRLGQVDAALIPAVEFIARGSYHSLDFGMGCRASSQSMILYSYGKLEELKTVRAYKCSSSSSALLKLLLKEKWGITPKFERENRLEFLDKVTETEGALMLHELPSGTRKQFPVALDLASVWHKETGLPFVFLIWAVRPGALTSQQLTLLHETMYKGVNISRELACASAASYGTTEAEASVFVGDDRRYYLDDFLLSGLEEFIQRAQRRFLMPKVEYRSVKRSLYGEVLIRPSPRFSH